MIWFNGVCRVGLGLSDGLLVNVPVTESTNDL